MAAVIEPIDDRFGVFGHGGCEDGAMEPFRDFFEEEVDVWAFVDVVEDDVFVDEDFDHVVVMAGTPGGGVD